MSFFQDVLDSLESGKPVPPPKPKSTVANPPQLGFDSKKLGINPITNGEVGTEVTKKRKFDDEKQRLKGASSGPDSQARLDKDKTGPSSLTSTPQGASKRQRPNTTPDDTGAQNAPPKVPSKGSFAELMAKAKLAQEQRGPSQVGIIKHQAATKEKAPKSHLADRQKEDAVERHGRPTKPNGARGKSSDQNVSPAKRPELPKSAAFARQPPRLLSTYKGTMGLQRYKSAPSTDPRRTGGKRTSRMDEYLGTDEEDEGDYDDDHQGSDYDSNESSDMEAGMFDIDREEEKALKQAREDDAREEAVLKKHEKEKSERRRKMEALASKQR